MTRGGRLVSGQAPAGAVEAFGWVDRWVLDDAERKAIMTWARCRAAGKSWSEQCDGLGWRKRTAEKRRRLAAERIVEGLGMSPDLDPRRVRRDALTQERL